MVIKTTFSQGTERLHLETVNFMLKMSLTQQWRFSAAPRRAEGGLGRQMRFHCGLRSVVWGFGISHGKARHPRGWPVCLVSRRPPGSAVITTSLPEDSTRGHSVRARKHFFFLLIQTVQFPSDLQMSGWLSCPAHLPHLAPGTYCSRATWQKTDSAFKQSCLLGHRLYKTKTTVPLDSINL